MKLNKPIVFFDIETTGLDIVTSKIVQIACIKLKMDGTQEEKEMLINPQMPIPKEVSEIHGITDEMVKDAPTFSQIAKSLYGFFEDCDIAGYNSDLFDIPLLSQEFSRQNIVFPNWEYNQVDILRYERLLRPNKLSDVYQRYTGKELENAHNALADVRATLEILLHQADGKDEITPKEIDEFCQGNKKRFDVAGKTYLDADNVVRWSFGKNVNMPVLNDKSYLEWVLRNDFPAETKIKLNQLLKQ